MVKEVNDRHNLAKERECQSKRQNTEIKWAWGVSLFEGIRDQPRLQTCWERGQNEDRKVLWEKTMKNISKFFKSLKNLLFYDLEQHINHLIPGHLRKGNTLHWPTSSILKVFNFLCSNLDLSLQGDESPTSVLG